jgi:hypothetical protein
MVCVFALGGSLCASWSQGDLFELCFQSFGFNCTRSIGMRTYLPALMVSLALFPFVLVVAWCFT